MPTLLLFIQRLTQRRNCNNFCFLLPVLYSLLPVPYSLFPIPFAIVINND
ncbi:MAG: hypothetical protein F6K26_07805 [Moorea sp. SIO2I5]|nr:hypothetical protein [Moorena sp. SIO2I5]